MGELRPDMLIGMVAGPLIWALAVTGPILWLLGFGQGPARGLCRVAFAGLQALTVSLLLATAAVPDQLGTPAVIAVLGWPVTGPYRLALGALELPWSVGLPAALGLGAAIAVGALSAGYGRLVAMLCPAAATIAFFAAFIVAGEVRFHLALRSAAARLAPDCLDAGSWRHSIAIAGQHPQPHLHAGARKGADRYGWSHRANRFYRIPEQAYASVGPGTRSWLPLPYRGCSP